MLEVVGLGAGGLDAVAAGDGPLAARGQQVDEAVPGLPPGPRHPPDGPHAAAGRHLRGAAAVGLIQLGDEPPLVSGLGHGLDVGVQLGQGLVCLVALLGLQTGLSVYEGEDGGDHWAALLWSPDLSP